MITCSLAALGRNFSKDVEKAKGPRPFRVSSSFMVGANATIYNIFTLLLLLLLLLCCLL